MGAVAPPITKKQANRKTVHHKATGPKIKRSPNPASPSLLYDSTLQQTFLCFHSILQPVLKRPFFVTNTVTFSTDKHFWLVGISQKDLKEKTTID